LNFRFQVINPLLANEGKKKPMLSDASFEAGLWSRIWLLLFMVLASLQIQAQTDTCQLSNKNGTVHQVVCHGATYKIKAETSDENATVQWYRQNNTSGWTAVTGGTNTQLTANHGIFKAIFTHSDNSTCETENDTITEWKAYQIDWTVAACRAQISGATALPFPEQISGAEELSTPIDPQGEISFGWQVIPEPVQASFATSSNSIYPMTDGFFQDTTLGLHQVVLTVSQYGSECVSVDTMEVTLLPLNVWADTIISYGGQPAIAVAHASGGTEPYAYTWSSLDTCLSAGCDSVVVSGFSQPVSVTVTDGVGCGNSSQLNFVYIPTMFPELEVQSTSKSTITLKWKKAKGAPVLIIAQKSLPSFFQPESGVAYIGNTTWALSPQVGSSDRIVFAGEDTDSTITVIGLDSLTSYYFKIYLIYDSRYYSNLQISYGFTKGFLRFNDEIIEPQTAEIQFLKARKEYQDKITTKNILEKIQGLQMDSDQEIVLPVVFHFVGVPGQQSYELGKNVCRINSALNSLNDFFGNTTPTALNGTPAKTNIRFCLAKYRPDGEAWQTATNGVMLHPLSATQANGISYLANVTSLENVNWMKSNIWSATPWTEVINIVILESFSAVTYIDGVPYQRYAGMYYNQTYISYIRAPFFGSSLQGHNGTCIPDELPSGRSNGDVLAHEVGHQLSLDHTFSSSCTDINCSEDGDKVCDTPPAKGEWDYCSQPPTNNPSDCQNMRAVENVMDYTPDNCQYTFSATPGQLSQKARMRQSIFDYKQTLISPENLYKWFGMQGCGGTTFAPSSTIKMFQGTYYNCDVAGSSVLVGCTKVYEVTGPEASYQFTLITSSGDEPIEGDPHSNTRTLILENWDEDVYGLKCTIVIPGMDPLELDPVYNLFKVMDCENTLPDEGTWFLDNRCKVGFSSEIGSSSTIESFPMYDVGESNRISIHTANSSDGTFSFYTDGYYLFNNENIKIPGTRFTTVEDGSDVGEIGFNCIDDILKVNDHNYIVLVWFEDIIHSTNGFKILRVFQTGSTWQVVDMNSLSTDYGYMKFVAGCESGKFRILYTSKQNGLNGYQVLEVNSANWNVQSLNSWVISSLPVDQSFEVSPEGSMIATEDGTILHFDASLATLSSVAVGGLNFSTWSLPLIHPCFSQNGKYLYYKRMEFGGATIYRTEIGTSCGLGITKSILLPELNGFTFEKRRFAIGPDHLMYFPEIEDFDNTTSALSAIQNSEPSDPDEPINIIYNKIKYFDSDFRLDFAFQPINGKTVDALNQYFKVCQDCKTVRAISNYCNTVTIDFGDGTLVSNANDATHTYACPTGQVCNFTVSVKENNVIKMQRSITISDPPTLQ
jgi:hypothetical protein